MYYNHIQLNTTTSNSQISILICTFRLQISEMLKVVSFTLLFVVSFALQSFSQLRSLGTPTITNFLRSEYQAGTQNWCIGQDTRGIMYFGNNKGLLEYDGTHWQTYNLPNSTIVRSFAFASTGRIYLGGQNELGYISPDINGAFEYTSLVDSIPTELWGFDDVWKIIIREGAVYFCSEKAIFMYQNGQIQTLSARGERFENFFDVEGTIYLQSKSKDLYTLQDRTLKLVASGALFGIERLVAMLPFRDARLLLISVSKGLFTMDGNGSIVPWQNEVSEFLIRNQAYCGIRLHSGGYAIGTSQDGVVLFDEDGKHLLHLNRSTGLQNNTVLSIFQDRQSNIWLGLDNGIDHAETNSPFSVIRSEQGIKGTGYSSILQNNKLYLGTNQGLFYTNLGENNNLLSQPIFKEVGNGIGQVWDIAFCGDDLIVSQHKGASYLIKDSLVTFSDAEGSWKFMELVSHAGYAIEGTYNGIALYQKTVSAGRDTTPYWARVRILPGFNESARVFEEDGKGDIWVSHAYKGLYKLKMTEGLDSIAQIKFYDTNQGLPEELFINVSKVRNELIFTTPKGVYSYSDTTDSFLPHQDFENIFGKGRKVHRMLEDRLGNIWFSIDNEFGMLQVNDTGVVNKFELLYFNQLQEELVDGFEHIFAADAENFFIGSEKGFIHLCPSRQSPNEDYFKVLIRKVTSITSGDSIVSYGNLTESVDNIYPHFDDKMNDFRFDFSAPYFEKSNYLQYRYKLEGFDSEWSTWAAKTQKEYTNLPSGTYKFTVQARNGYGQETTSETYAFTIDSPWYATTYARIVYLVVCILILFAIAKFISRREKKKTEIFKLEQTEKLRQKEAEFKSEVEKSENEIITLKNEKLSIDVNHKTSQLASATMHLVQKSEMLRKIKGDLTHIGREAPFEFKKKVDQIARTIESDIQLDNNWEQFEIYFDQVHENFFKRLRQQFPDLTPKDQKLCAYLRMNLTTKEIAPLLNISVRGVEISRYRVRKKLGIESDTNLVAFIMDV